MIFVCTGSRGYQFNRLIEEVDRLAAIGELGDEVFAQIGDSAPPKHIAFERYIDKERFTQLQREADLIISHAGTGALISALKLGKQVIAVPRLAEYGEHIDDHQTQIAEVLAAKGYLRQVTAIADLGRVIRQCTEEPLIKVYAIESRIIGLIEAFLDDNRVG